MNTVELLARNRIVPVVTTLNPDDADSLADALLAGGSSSVEMTLRTPEALNALRRLARRSNLTVGAGTVLSVDQAKAAMDAGASFLVAPGFDPNLVHFARQSQIPFLPGVATATDLTHAFNDGLRVVKFFPATAMGGIETIRALAGPFPGMKFMPTGGITPATIRPYLESNLIIAVGMSIMVTKELVSTKKWDEVTLITKQVAELARTVTPGQ